MTDAGSVERALKEVKAELPVVPVESAVGGLPQDDPVWRRLGLRGSIRVVAEAWLLADKATGIALAMASDDAERGVIDAEIQVTMQQLKQELDELLVQVERDHYQR